MQKLSIWGIRKPVLSGLHFIKLWNCNPSEEVRKKGMPAVSAWQQYHCYWSRKKTLPWEISSSCFTQSYSTYWTRKATKQQPISATVDAEIIVTALPAALTKSPRPTPRMIWASWTMQVRAAQSMPFPRSCSPASSPCCSFRFCKYAQNKTQWNETALTTCSSEPMHYHNPQVQQEKPIALCFPSIFSPCPIEVTEFKYRFYKW